MCVDNHTIEEAKNYIQFKAGALKQENGKFKAVSAARMQRKVSRSFKRQMEWLVAESEGLSFFNNKSAVLRLERKSVQDEINKFLEELPDEEDIADAVAGGGEVAYRKGAKAAHTKFEMDAVGIDFSLINNDAIDYLKAKKTLHLSNYRGSISRTTKKQILKILTDAAETGQSYQETGRKIKAQGEEGVFSRYRSEMIATNEIGHAYGSGNHEMVDIYHQETGAIIEKYWITVQDDRVTEECAANEDTGWIGFNEHFPSGDDIAPRDGNPRCRCDCGYRRVDLHGNPV